MSACEFLVSERLLELRVLVSTKYDGWEVLERLGGGRRQGRGDCECAGFARNANSHVLLSEFCLWLLTYSLFQMIEHIP